jgi:hypothetical protein
VWWNKLLVASNANVGGPTTAAGMATAKKWRSLVGAHRPPSCSSFRCVEPCDRGLNNLSVGL